MRGSTVTILAIGFACCEINKKTRIATPITKYDSALTHGDGRGISYGSLYNYDSHVPLILYGAPFETQLFETLVESVDLAPTLARVAGIGWPSSSTGRVLGEALISAAEA